MLFQNLSNVAQNELSAAGLLPEQLLKLWQNMLPSSTHLLLLQFSHLLLLLSPGATLAMTRANSQLWTLQSSLQRP